MSKLLDLAQSVIALATKERARRVASGDTNHVDEEDYLLPRWKAFVAAGDNEAVLRAAYGYLLASRVSLKPSNPAFAHEAEPNADEALALAEAIQRSSAFDAHRAARAALAKLPGVGEGAQPIVGSFTPGHSCYSAYDWLVFGGSGAVAFRVVNGGRFVCYALLDDGEFKGCAARYASVRKRLGVAA